MVAARRMETLVSTNAHTLPGEELLEHGLDCTKARFRSKPTNVAIADVSNFSLAIPLYLLFNA